jgi:hypothetical protein
MSSDRHWVIRTWVLAAVFLCLTLWRSHEVGIPLRDPHGEIFATRLATSCGLLVLLVTLDAGVRAQRHYGSWRSVRRAMRDRWPRRRLVVALLGLLAYHLVYFCYHNLKSWDVFNAPRDQMLLGWDRWLLFGHSPAVLLHDLLGQGLSAYMLLVVYESFSTILAVALVAAVVFTARMRDGYVFIASAIWTWILGVGSYYLIPSLGPFTSAPREFAGLPHTMVQDTQARYMAQRAYLLAHPHAHDAFAQVSAFASLHVAFITLLVLMARYYGLRRLTRLLSVFLVCTMTATVYLGWHFMVDDLAGLLIATIAVALGRLTIYPPRRSVAGAGPLLRRSPPAGSHPVNGLRMTRRP